MKTLHPAEVSKIKMEIEQMKKTILKLDREIFWYPVAISTGLIMAVAAALTLILKAIGRI